MKSLSVSQIENIEGGGCASAIGAGLAGGAWLGLKAGARAAPLLAWTGVGSGAILIAGGVIGAISGAAFAWGTACDEH